MNSLLKISGMNNVPQYQESPNLYDNLKAAFNQLYILSCDFFYFEIPF